MIKVLFECHHLYYLANFIPIIKEMKKRERYNITATIPYDTAQREKNIFKNALEDLDIILIQPGNEKQRIKKIINDTFDVVIVGNIGNLNKIVNNKTLAVMVYHGIGLKQSYYMDIDNRIDIRSVESASRNNELNNQGFQNLSLTGYTKCDPLAKKENKIDLKDLGLKPNKNTVLYAPSFYPSSIDKLLPYLEEISIDNNLIIKLHNFSWHQKRYKYQSKEILKLTNKCSNIYLASPEEFNIIPFYQIADVLLSDISSTIFEYLYLNRPIIMADCFTLRIKHKLLKRRFLKKMDLARMKAVDFAYKLSNPEKLKKLLNKAIENPLLHERERLKAQREYLYKTDGKASSRLIDSIENKLNIV